MTIWLPRWIAMVLLVLPFAPVVADDPDDAEIARLVKQLGSSDYGTREAATKRLKEIGEPALDALGKLTTPLEARRRAEAIVADTENKVYVELLRLTGHASDVWTVSVSADGKRLLTSSKDKTLRLWDAATGKELRVFEGYTKRICGAALSPDGRRVLSGSIDGTVRLWDVTTGKELLTMTCPVHQVFGVVFGPEGKAITGGVDLNMHVWDLKTGKKAGVFTGHTDEVHKVAYSDEAKLAATCSNDGSIRLWDLEISKEVHKLIGHTGGVVSVCFSPNGKCLLSAGGTIERGGDATLRIWDVETGKELKRINAANAFCVAFSPNGKRIVSGGYLDMTWDGKRLVSGDCVDRTVRIWDVESGKELRKYEGHTDLVTCVAFFPDGKRIASASADGTARIWRAPR